MRPSFTSTSVSTAPYRIASVWLAVKQARHTKVDCVVLSGEEDVEAARAIKSVRVCTCSARAEAHIHTRKE